MGSALVSILDDHGADVGVVDVGVRPFLTEKTDFLHVSIPYSNKFLPIVKEEIKRYKPNITIIHSTVPVGTTRKIGRNVAHSPVRGQHDDLRGSLARFVKYVAGVTPSAGEKAAKHLITNGFRVEKWGKPEETEMMKGLCLSRYLHDLAFYENSDRLCAKYGIDSSKLLSWTKTYNEGYAGTKYTRPDFTFPKGKVGGHCVMPVSKMFFDQTRDPWLGKNIRIFNRVIDKKRKKR